MGRYVVQGYGNSWSVLDGIRIVAWFRSWELAEERRERLERKARAKLRPCLTCGSHFISEGPHNRMCPACRQQSLHDGTV